MAIKDNESVYDAEIAPLMEKIIAICKASNIPLLATFQLTGDDDVSGSPMMCTTAVCLKEADHKLIMARKALGPIFQTGVGGIAENRG